MRRTTLGLLLCLLFAGCGTAGDAGSADAGRTDAGFRDAALLRDGGSDAGPAVEDAGQADAGPGDAGAPDAGPPDAGSLCTVGGLCNDAQPCPGEDRCYGFDGDGFCAHFTPECGGIAKTRCTAGRVCLRGGGGSLGYCATPDERRCICDMAATRGMSVDGC